MRWIELLISPRGETKIQTHGYSGTSCLAASRALEQALGQATAEQKTSDYFAIASAEQPLQQHQ